ncbi:MAG: SCP2 sterol-binding domain-containing protein [Myxococcales bacterium]|nr:SCP2 sterol-binding domain-containing protein [Myxococcales bacterium]
MAIEQPKDYFEREMLEKIADDPSKVAGFEGVLQFNITGDAGGKWYAHISGGKAEVKEGEHASPSIQVTMKDKDFVNFINGKLSGQMAFMTGKLKFKGDMSMAMKLQKLL